MIESVTKIIKSSYGAEPTAIKKLGGGFYGRAFHVSLRVPPYQLVAKLYLFPGLAAEEAAQINLLSQHALLKMPKIFQLGFAEEGNWRYDYVLMEYLKGINLGFTDISLLPEETKERIANQIIDNLLAYHNATNPKGFGKINSALLCSTWQEYYYPIACSIAEKAHTLYEAGQIDDYIINVIDKSLLQFDAIFCEPITKSSLIHGDYNTWNIFLTEDKKNADAVIDPFNSCWADNEYDLYQLDNANGKGLSLLKLYQQKKGSSANFYEKRLFYELFTELNHYHDAHVAINFKTSMEQAKRLNEILL